MGTTGTDVAPFLVDVSTRLLENYRSVTPAVSGNLLAVAETPTGPVIAGIDTTNTGFVLVQDPASESGWTSVPLGAAILNGVLAAITDLSGQPHVFACDGANLLHATKSGPEPTNWTPLESIPIISGCSQIAVLNNGGNTHVAALTGGYIGYGVATPDTPGQFQWFPNVAPFPVPPIGSRYLQLFPSRDQGALIASVLSQTGSLQVPVLTLFAGSGGNWSQVNYDSSQNGFIGDPPYSGIVNGEEIALFDAATPEIYAMAQPAADSPWSNANSGLFDNTDASLTAFKPWVDPATGLVVGLAVGFDTQGANAGYGQIYLVEAQTNPLSGQWSLTSLGAGEPGEVVPVSQSFVAVADTSFAIKADPVTGLMRAFAIDMSSNLCVMQQQADGWTPLLPTGHHATALWPVNHPDGYTQVVALGTNGLYVLSYSAEDTEWTRTDIELNLPDKAATYNCYSTEITITDANGVFQPGAEATIKCSDPMEARINGVTTAVDPETPLPVTANRAGRITIETPIHSLNSPEILINVETMEPGSWISIVPQLEVEAKVRTATASVDSFLAQKDHNGNYVVTGPLRQQPLQAEQVALSITRCCDLAASAGTQFSAFHGPLRRNRQPNRVRYLPPGEARSGRHLNFAAIEPVSWSLDFSSGSPVFSILTDEQAAALVDPMGLFGVDWGSVWGSIRDGVSNLVSVIVRVVVDPVTKAVTAIEAAVTALIEGVQQAFSATVNLLEQVFDVIEGIFTKIATFFKELILWLAFFFDWQDIKLTKYAVKYLVNQSFDLFDGAMASQQTSLPNLIRGVGQSLQDWYNNSKPSVRSVTLLQGDDQNPPPEYAVEGRSHNIVQSNLFDGISSGSVAVGAPAPQWNAETEHALTSLMDLLEQLGQQISDTPGFATASNYITSMAGKLARDPDEFLTTAIDDMLGVMVALGTAALQLTANVLETLIGLLRQIFRLFQEVLNWEIYIPVITPLYEWLTGDTLTFIDVFCLAAAVAITLTYKIATGDAPFTQKSLKQFEADWAAPNLLALAGMGPEATPAPVPAENTKQMLGNIIMLLLNFLSGVCDAFADADAMDNQPGFDSSVLATFVDLATFVIEIPYAPFLSDPITGPPTILTVDGLFAVSWLFDGFTTAVDAGCILKTRHRAKFEAWGQTLYTVTGICQFAIYSGIIGLQVEAGDWDTSAQLTDIGSMFGYLPDVSSLLILAAKNPELHEAAKIAQVTLDILGPWVGGVMVFAGSQT